MPDSMKNVTGRFPKNHILKRIRGFFGEKDIILEDRSKKFIFIQKINIKIHSEETRGVLTEALLKTGGQFFKTFRRLSYPLN